MAVGAVATGAVQSDARPDARQAFAAPRTGALAESVAARWSGAAAMARGHRPRRWPSWPCWATTPAPKWRRRRPCRGRAPARRPADRVSSAGKTHSHTHVCSVCTAGRNPSGISARVRPSSCSRRRFFSLLFFSCAFSPFYGCMGKGQTPPFGRPISPLLHHVLHLLQAESVVPDESLGVGRRRGVVGAPSSSTRATPSWRPGCVPFECWGHTAMAVRKEGTAASFCLLVCFGFFGSGRRDCV